MSTTEPAHRPEITWSSAMLDCDDPKALAQFYAELLGGAVTTFPFTDDWACVAPPGTGMTIAFQRDADYRRPVWPATAPGDQRQMAHLDFAVTDSERAVAFALSLGATLPPAQFCPPDWPQPWTTLLDPAGHPFCLTQVGAPAG